MRRKSIWKGSSTNRANFFLSLTLPSFIHKKKEKKKENFFLSSTLFTTVDLCTQSVHYAAFYVQVYFWKVKFTGQRVLSLLTVSLICQNPELLWVILHFSLYSWLLWNGAYYLYNSTFLAHKYSVFCLIPTSAMGRLASTMFWTSSLWALSFSLNYL